MSPSGAATRATALLCALAVWSCNGDDPPTPMPDAGIADAGSNGGTVVNAPDNQAQRYVSTDPRYSATWTFALRDQVAIPNAVREVYVEVRGCRRANEPAGVIRYQTPESTSWRELSVDKPLCNSPGTPSTQVWLPVSDPPRLVVEAVQPSIGTDSYVLTTVTVLGWRLP